MDAEGQEQKLHWRFWDVVYIEPREDDKFIIEELNVQKRLSALC